MSTENPPDSSRRSSSLARDPGQPSKRAVCFETPRNGGERVRLALDIEPRYEDSITVSDPDGREYADEPPDLPIPGFGEQYDECGDDIPFKICDNPDCLTPMWVGNTCRRSLCPRCWQSWVFQRAVEAATAVDATRAAMYDRMSGNVYNHHVVVSSPDGTCFDSDDALARYMDAGKVLLGHVNARAGYLVYHPKRIKDEYRGDVLGHASGDGDMMWKDVLELPADERDEYLTHSPHLHAFVASPNVSEADVYDETGMVIHRIADDDGTSLGDLEDLAAAVAYSLSHAGIAYDDETETHRVAARFFGETANIERPDWIRDRALTAMREVAGRVLGVSFRRQTECQEPVGGSGDHDHGHDHGRDHDAAPPAMRSLSTRSTNDDRDPFAAADELTDGFGFPTGSDSAWSGGNSGGYATDSGGSDARGSTVVVSDTDTDNDNGDGDGGERETCGGNLRPVNEVPEMLADDDLREQAGDDAVQTALSFFEEWVSLGSPRPEDLRGDDPPPD